MQRDGATLNMVLRIFLRVIAQSLQSHSPGAAQVDKAALHIGAVAFIHRFGSSLNEHVHFHVCVVDGVFVALAGGADAGVDTDTQAVADGQSSPSKVIFHPASGIDEIAVAQVQATLRRRILRAFVGRGLLESFEASVGALRVARRRLRLGIHAPCRAEGPERLGSAPHPRQCLGMGCRTGTTTATTPAAPRWILPDRNRHPATWCAAAAGGLRFASNTSLTTAASVSALGSRWP